LNSAGKTSSTLRPNTAREFHDETLPADGAKVAHFALCVDKILFYEDLTKIRDVAEAEKEWQPNQRFIEQGKNI
jgi:thiamine biosynthesis protein ThiC